MRKMMGRKLFISFAFLFVFLVGNISGVSASSALQEITAYLDNSIHIMVYGVPFTAHDSDGTVLAPINYNGNTYLPLRAVAEATGMEVKWDNNTRTAILGSPSSGVEGTQTYTSSDKTFQLSLPSGWIRNDKTMMQENPIFIFGAANPTKSLFLGIVKEGKDGFTDHTTLDDYAKMSLSQTSDAVENIQISPVKDIKINGYAAKQFVVTGVIGNVKAGYLMTFIETNSSFYHITIWSTADKINKAQDDVDLITQSFKEVN